MEIRFWGVRGSVAASGAGVSRIGGNTSCVEIRSGEHRIILDSGTGIRSLGEAMMREGKPAKATLLFSHLHWDHVQGFPLFTPAYLPNSTLTLYGPGADGAQALHSALSRQMLPPSFPVTLEAMRSKMEFKSAVASESFEVGPFKVTPFEVPHPDGCIGYRIECEGKSFVYATDVELCHADLTLEIAAAMQNADLLCLDAQYTPDEYEGKGSVCKKGWGHSTMIDAAKIAGAVNARRLVLFHHDPSHTDEMVENMAEEARLHFSAAEPAREGKQIVLGGSPRAAA